MGLVLHYTLHDGTISQNSLPVRNVFSIFIYSRNVAKQHWEFLTVAQLNLE
jgi:hypothetical protein